MTRAPRPGLLGAALVVASCGAWSGAGPDCTPTGQGVALPASIPESSGVAFATTREGAWWTHNDGDDGVLYAVDAGGTLLQQVRVDVPARDWEDLAAAPCPAGRCLWIADTGDNYRERDHAVVYRVPEPAPDDTAATGVEAFRFRYPDGPRDVEALFVTPDGALYLVSKGGGFPATVYRYPEPLRSDATVTLTEVQRLGEEARTLPAQVTGASATPDGRTVAIRTYESLDFMALRDSRLHPIEGTTVNLRTLREGQGEGVAVGDDGRVVLTSEAGPLGGRGSLTTLRCTLPDPGGDPGPR